MAVPPRSEVYDQLIEHLRLAQESAATIGHLHADDPVTGKAKAMGFLAISEALREMQHKVRMIATSSSRRVQ